MRRLAGLTMIWIMGLLALRSPAMSVVVPHASVARIAPLLADSGPGSPGPFWFTYRSATLC